MPYSIIYLKKVVTDDIPALPKTIRQRIKTAIEDRLVIDPFGFGKPLRYSLKAQRSLRVGDYRILYSIDGNQVTISAIKHRKCIYEDA